MNKKLPGTQSFGALLTALMTQRGLNQETLGAKTKLGVTVIDDIEKNKRGYLSAYELEQLVNGLGLTSRERKDFVYAASGVDDEKMVRGDPNEILNKLLERLRNVRLPAFIIDVYNDVIAINDSLITLTNGDHFISTGRGEIGGFNAMRYVFDHSLGFKELLGENQWNSAAELNIQFFRSATLRYRSTVYFQKLLDAFTDTENNRYESFREHWGKFPFATTDYAMYGGSYQFEHPRFGPLNYVAGSSEAVTSCGELHFVSYMALDAATEKTFRKVLRKHGGNMTRLASWPDKD